MSVVATPAGIAGAAAASYGVRIPQLKEDKRFRRWWNGRSETKCAKAWLAVQDGIRCR